MANKQTLRGNQQGMVSIVVTMIIMVVLTLIVTGFAQLARREQRESLDRQLSTQALYAAESGINDAIKAINAGNISNKPDCDTSIPGVSPQINGTDVQYTCLLINSNNDTNQYQNVGTESSTLAPVILASGANPSSISIDWQNKDGAKNVLNGLSGSTPLLKDGEWGQNVGILRIDLVPIDSLNIDNLKANTLTAFLYPKNSGAGQVVYSSIPDNKGAIVTSKCGSSSYNKKCRVTITNLDAHNKYLIRMKSIYTTSDVEICANACNDQVADKLTGQYNIDSTGRASDVLKRIKVRYGKESGSSNAVFAEYALDSANDVCKLMSVWPGPDGGSEVACPRPISP